MHREPGYGEQFSDRSIAEAYHNRPPYPHEVFEILSWLITDKPRTVLDAGCGTGDIARGLAPYVDRIDAVDLSAAMIEEGKRLPGGDHPHIIWIVSRLENAPLTPPYALVVAGMSLHCMDWGAVLPRIERALSPRAWLAIAGRFSEPTPWRDALMRIIQRYAPRKEYGAHDVAGELTKRGLFHANGEKSTRPVRFTQTLEAYIEAMHSTPGLSRDRMSREAAEAFDAEAREVLVPYCAEGRLEMQIVGKVVWGLPERLG